MYLKLLCCNGGRITSFVSQNNSHRMWKSKVLSSCFLCLEPRGITLHCNTPSRVLSHCIKSRSNVETKYESRTSTFFLQKQSQQVHLSAFALQNQCRNLHSSVLVWQHGNLQVRAFAFQNQCRKLSSSVREVRQHSQKLHSDVLGVGHQCRYLHSSVKKFNSSPLAWCSRLDGAAGILHGKVTPPLHTSTRSIGVKVSTVGGNEEGVYIPTPTEKCYELLEYIHDSIGLPWWLTILATTILFRGVIVFPFAVWQQKILARIENAQPLVNAYVEQIKQQLAIIAKEEGWSKRKMSKVFTKEVRLLVSNIHFKEKCSSHKLTYLPLWQAGVWLSMTTAIGQMTGKQPELFMTELDIDVLPSLANEGLLWFSDLMQTDFTLAVLLGIVNVTLVELWSLRRGPLTQTQNFLHNSFRIAAFFSIPAATMLPAAVSFYWLVSSLCGLGQLALLRTPSIRRKLGIPHTPSEMKRPLEEIQAGLKARYSKKVV